MKTDKKRLILVTGSTGYVGGRLFNALETRGHRVRCMVRRPEVLQGRVAPATQIACADVSKPETLSPVLQDVDTAYYLIHSLGSVGNFEEQERNGAAHFSTAAKRAGVRRIIYLGGLCNEENPHSPHMRSRRKVGEVLRASGVETIEFQASVIIGSGSLSFELVRSLVQRLPVMITPRWVSVKAQPIAINDVLSYLVAALELEPGANRIYQIGGADQVSYLELMKEYARLRGLRRLLIPVPVLTPWLSSLWLGLVTPLFARIGRKLIDSMTMPSIVTCPAAATDFSIHPVGVRDAFKAAMRNEDKEFAQTHWSGAVSSAGSRRSWAGVRFANRVVDTRTAEVAASCEQAFEPIMRIGGQTGWYYADWLWQVRGVLDRMVGGVGMKRGRRDRKQLRVGDVVDCWRVEACEPPGRLRLVAEMRLPGRAWLQFEVTPSDGRTLIRQTAEFDPVGLLGLVYWYAPYPLHQLVFCGMLRNIARAATRHEARGNTMPSDI